MAWKITSEACPSVEIWLNIASRNQRHVVRGLINYRPAACSPVELLSAVRHCHVAL